MVFPVVMYGRESWTVKKAEHWRIDAFELWCWRRLESPLDCKEIQPVHSEGDQPWVFIGRTDAKAKTPVLWPPHAKSWLIGKDSDAGRDWGQEEKGTTEDEMVGWHHRLNRNGFGWTPGVGDGQGGLECCDSWGRKELDMTERLNRTELKMIPAICIWYQFQICLRCTHWLSHFILCTIKKFLFTIDCILCFLFIFYEKQGFSWTTVKSIQPCKLYT